MNHNFLSAGSNIVFENQKAMIASVASNAFLLRFKNGNTQSFPTMHIETACNEGRLLPDLDPPGSDSSFRTLLTEEDVQEINRKLAYLRLLRESDYPASEAERKRVIQIVAKRLGESIAAKEAPSISQLWRWNKIYEDSGQNGYSLLRKNKHQKRQSRVSDLFLELMDDAIDKHYLQENGKSISGTYADFEEVCKKRNYEPKSIPSYETFRKYVKNIHPLDRLRAREGAAAARKAGRTIEGVYMPRRPLERVEVDAVHLNLGLVDAGNQYLGKVVLFVAIDVFSRAVLGYAFKVSRNPSEDGETAIECLKMAMRFKPKSSFPFYLLNDWEMTGKIDTVVVDPGTSVIAKSMTMFLAGLGIHREITASRSPWRKPFIERFFRTLRGELMEVLPGYAPKRTAKYLIDYNLPKEACLTIEEFESCLVRYIVDGYHQFQHRGLGGKTPHEMWHEGIQNHGAPELVHNMEFLNKFAANQLNYASSIQTGVGIKGIQYNSRELEDLTSRLAKPDGKCRVDLLWSSHDVSEIQVYDPINKRYLTVPSKFPRVAKGTRHEEFKAKNPKVTCGTRLNPVNNQNAEIIAGKKRRKQAEAEGKNRAHPTPTETSRLSEKDLEAQLNDANIDLNPEAAELKKLHAESPHGIPVEKQFSTKPSKPKSERFSVRKRT